MKNRLIALILLLVLMTPGALVCGSAPASPS